jgi:hypothetical protein
MKKSELMTEYVAEPQFWHQWKGSIIRAIVLNGLYTKNEILKRTQLEEERFEQALGELLQMDILTKMKNDRFLVSSSELTNEYRNFFKNVQETLIKWVNQWREQERVMYRRTEPNHFFLEDKLLYEFSEKLIEHATVEILVANPFVQRCYLSDSLMEISKKGVNVKLITRSSSKYINELSNKGVSITYDESVHAKLITVDDRVGIVSSMNLFANSSGGGTWEAGLVTIEEDVVKSIARSILKKT